MNLETKCVVSKRLFAIGNTKHGFTDFVSNFKWLFRNDCFPVAFHWKHTLETILVSSLIRLFRNYAFYFQWRFNFYISQLLFPIYVFCFKPIFLFPIVFVSNAFLRSIGGWHIRVSHLIQDSHTLESHTSIFKIAFLKSTVTFGSIWLAQNIRLENTNLLIHLYFTKSYRAFSESDFNNWGVRL